MRTNHLELFSKLEAVKRQEPALAGLMDMQKELLVTAEQLEPPAALDVPEASRVQAWLKQGIPLLQAMPPNLDWEQFWSRFQQVCEISARHLADKKEAIEAVLQQAQPTALRAAAADALRAPSAGEGSAHGAVQEMFSFVLDHTLQPFLKVYAEQLAPHMNDELWQQGFCPVCAGWPDLAIIDDSTRSRRLVCSRCDTQWRFPRVKCPFCGASEAADLSYYPGPEKKYRLYVCNQCRGYLKAIDTSHAGTKFLLPVERVQTLSMDLAAQEAGYG